MLVFEPDLVANFLPLPLCPPILGPQTANKSMSFLSIKSLSDWGKEKWYPGPPPPSFGRNRKLSTIPPADLSLPAADDSLGGSMGPFPPGHTDATSRTPTRTMQCTHAHERIQSSSLDKASALLSTQVRWWIAPLASPFLSLLHAWLRPTAAISSPHSAGTSPRLHRLGLHSFPALSRRTAFPRI